MTIAMALVHGLFHVICVMVMEKQGVSIAQAQGKKHVQIVMEYNTFVNIVTRALSFAINAMVLVVIHNLTVFSLVGIVMEMDELGVVCAMANGNQPVNDVTIKDLLGYAQIVMEVD